jgi:hypothetical protein
LIRNLKKVKASLFYTSNRLATYSYAVKVYKTGFNLNIN